MLKFNDAEREVLTEFQQAINSHGTILSLEDICRQAIFYAINDSRRRAQELAVSAAQDIASSQSQGNTDGNTTSGNTEGDNTETLVSETPNPSMDAQQETSGDTSPPTA